MDFASVAGTGLAVAAVFGGQIWMGGGTGQLLQSGAAFIVLGGTAAAVLLSSPFSDIKRALGMMPLVFWKVEVDVRPLIEEITSLAAVARKEGVLAVESQRASIKDPLLKKSIKYVIDGFDAATVREIIDAQIILATDQDESAVRVFEGAGAYAPTIGVIGAILGLMQVLSMLNDPSKIGEGIAASFIATLYGIVLANLVFLPWSAKLKRKVAQRMVSKEVVKLGVVGIQEGLNPHFLQEKLEVFVQEEKR